MIVQQQISRLKIIGLFLLISIQPLFAQQFNIKFENLTTEDGLSQNRVDCICRDSLGFMWFGTVTGLNRYDGYEFKVFKSDPNNTNSLSHDYITSIKEFKDGFLIIGTYDGLNIYDTKMDRFYRFYNDSTKKGQTLPGDYIYSVERYSDNSFLLGTNLGVAVVSIQLKERVPQLSFHKYQVFDDFNYTIKHSNIRSAHKMDEVIWLGTSDDGLFRLDTKKNEIRTIILHDQNDVLVSRINKFLHNKQNELWVATSTGLYVLDKDGNLLKTFYNRTNDYNGMAGNHVQDLIEDTDGNLWLGTYGGLSYYDKKYNEFVNFYSDPNDENSLTNDFIHCIYDDGNGIIWIGTENGGVSKIDRNTKVFYWIQQSDSNPEGLQGNIINSIFTNSDNDLWIGTSGQGLNHYNRTTGKFSSFKHDDDDASTISGDVISAILCDKDETMWFGTWGWGLNRLDSLDGKPVFTTVLSEPHVFIAGIVEGKYNRLWVSTSEGVLVRDEETGQFNPVLLHQVLGNDIRYFGDIEIDVSGNIVVTTESTRLIIIRPQKDYQRQLNPTKNDILHFKYSRDLPNTLPRMLLTSHTDNDGTLWIGSRGSGMVKVITNTLDIFDASMVEFRHYTEDQGLSDNLVVEILSDNHSNLWISTANGLSRFNYKTETFTNFYEEDGLTSNQFFWYAAHEDLKGNMYFGTTNGVNYFHPDSININMHIPDILITDFKILNKDVEIGRKGVRNHIVLPQSIAHAPELNLSYKDYIFSFSFSSTNYSATHKNRYAYMLEGFDKDWIYTDSEHRTASYTNIKKGSYKFRVKASNNDGIWNETGKVIKINILPPFHNTLFFKILISVLLVSIVLLAYVYRLKNLEQKTKELEAEVGKRTDQLRQTNMVLRDKNKEVISQYHEIENKSEEIQAQNEELEKQKEEIENAYNELAVYQNKLEDLVDERTKELKEAKEHAEESDRLKSSFLANMSHEIRTPLNAIMGFSSLIAVSEFSVEELEEMNEMIQTNGNALMQLINDIIDISLIEANQLEIYKSQFELNSFLNTLYTSMERQVSLNDKLKNLKVQLAIPKELEKEQVLITTDADRLTQIYNNLFGNALKYTKEGSIKIGYEICKDKNQLLFFVEDTGKGIAKEHLNDIFGRFTKIEEDISMLYRGTGLGLSICSNLVSILGGTIHVESKLGKGSKFVFQLPVNIQEDGEKVDLAKTKNTVQKDVNWENKTILIAEDEIHNFEVLKAFLRKTKVNILWAKNGQEAIDLVKQKNGAISLVLMDIKMPVLRGDEATKEIKLHYSVPIVAQTAYATTPEVKKFMQYGFDDYVLKPIEKSLLIDKIGKWLS